MNFRVIIQPPAKLDIDAAFIYLAQLSPQAAERWLDGIEDAIRSLGKFPNDVGWHAKVESFRKRSGN